MTIHVLDDEPRLCEELTDYLEGRGHTVTSSHRPSDCLKELRRESYDLLILDLRLPEQDGLTLLRSFDRNEEKFDTIMMSGHGDMDAVIEAIRAGAIDYIRKPFTLSEIAVALERAERLRTLGNEVQQLRLSNRALLRDSSKRLVGRSAAMDKVRRYIQVAGRNSAGAVLITGESGTGKELVAREIHRLSDRSEHPFVAVNCAAVPLELFESEFFGHKKGSFTGAAADHQGHFQAADGGTLFLDEVGELSLNAQAKFLRVLEDHEVRPVGSQREIPVNVRIVAATNSSLEEAVAAKAFRLDLLYRLNTIRIEVPPLRERREDIPELMDEFLASFSRTMGQTPVPVPASILKKMSTLAFLGNIRELRNLVERAMIFRDPEQLLGTSCLDPEDSALREGSKEGCSIEEGLPTLNLYALESRAVRLALERHDGVVAAAARELGITRQALLRRLEKRG